MLEAFLAGSASDRRARGYSYPYDEDQPVLEPRQMTQWAVALAADPELSTYLESPDMAEKAPQCRLMLAALTGDWAGLENLLKPQIEGGTVAPQLWKLWPRCSSARATGSRPRRPWSSLAAPS
jgi:hypothetical protein